MGEMCPIEQVPTLTGGWTPRASSKAAREVVLAACLAGAKAAAEAIREARTANFILTVVGFKL